MATQNFPEGCYCLTHDCQANALQDFGEGWTGWVQAIAEFGVAEGDKNPDQPCYVTDAVETAKLENTKRLRRRYPFNGDCQRCLAAMNLFIYPPQVES
jgi:hypothetical protein